jgi:hypothetical protein
MHMGDEKQKRNFGRRKFREDGLGGADGIIVLTI